MTQRRTGQQTQVTPISKATKPAKPVKSVPVGAEERLIWQRFIGPAQAALAQVQSGLATAEVLVVERMMEKAGLNPEDGWQFNVGTMRYEQRPVQGEPKE